MNVETTIAPVPLEWEPTRIADMLAWQAVTRRAIFPYANPPDTLSFASTYIGYCANLVYQETLHDDGVREIGCCVRVLPDLTHEPVEIVKGEEREVHLRTTMQNMRFTLSHMTKQPTSRVSMEIHSHDKIDVPLHVRDIQRVVLADSALLESTMASMVITHSSRVLVLRTDATRLIPREFLHRHIDKYVLRYAHMIESARVTHAFENGDPTPGELRVMNDIYMQLLRQFCSEYKLALYVSAGEDVPDTFRCVDA